MEQTFEYYVVDPHTWADLRPIETVKACTVNRDSDTETLGSATFDIDESIGECYIRAYLIASQNGVREKIALGTFLVQTPSKSFDGKSSSISLDAYTPLLELKEGMPPIGYYIAKGMNVMDTAYMLVRENARAPVIKPKCDTNLYYDFARKNPNKFVELDEKEFNEIKDKIGCEPGEKCFFSELDKIIKLALMTLPKDLRITLILREYEDLSYEDIAKITNTAIGTVKSRISRARLKLQKELKEFI